MAETGFGASLVISDDILKNLDKADEKINKLARSSKETSKIVVDAFSQMANGVDPFIAKLKEAQSILSKMNIGSIAGDNTNSNLGTLVGGLTKTREEAEKAANAMVVVGKEVSKVNSIQEARDTTLIDRKIIENYNAQIQKELEVAKIKEKSERREVENILFLEKKREEIARKEKATYQASFGGSMGMEEASMNQRIAKIKQLQIARAELSKTDADYKNKLDQLNAAILRLNRENQAAIAGSKELQQQHSKLMSTSDQLMRKIALVFSVSQISGYVNNMIKVRGEFELQNRSLAAILQNKEKADQLFDKITKLAVQSPFQLKELVTYTKQLAAYRVETEKLFDTTKMLADISAGLGVDMNRLILAYGQVKAANYLRGTELRQFSEAGINILGELSTYFTELEGNIVSVGDVFERVSNRMVKFSDVETIFKKMTSEGGIFYKMQEEQAETIAGQLSNLKDSFDVMMNSIGKANQDTIKTAIGAVKSLADNWETVVNAVNLVGIGFTAYTVKTILAANATKAFSASAIDATIKAGGLNAMVAKLKVNLSGMTKFALNPYVLIASGVAMLGMEMWDHIKAVDAVREKYDTLSVVLGKQRSEIGGIITKLKAQEDILNTTQANMDKLAKGTDEYTKEQQKNNDAQKTQNVLLNELKAKHPDIYAGLSKQKDGTLDLAKAQEELNKQLEQTNLLNYLAKQTEGYFGDGLMQNIEKLNENQVEYNKAVSDSVNAWTLLNGKVGAILASSKDVSEDTKKAFNEIANSSLSAGDKLQATLKLLFNDTSKLRSQFLSLADEAAPAYSRLVKSSEALSDTQKVLSVLINGLAEDFKRSYDTGTESGKKAAKETLRVFLDSLNLQEQAVIDFVTQQFSVKIGVELDTKETPNELTGFQKRINDYISSNKLSVDLITADQSPAEYFDQLNSALKVTNEQISQLENATEQIDEKLTNEEKIAVLKKEKIEQEQLLKAYGKYNEKQKETRNIYKERIDLVKKANSEYEKLLKNYDKETAKLKVQESYKDAFKEVGMGSAIFSMDFDKEGIINQLQDLAKKAGKASKLEFEKAIADFKTELDVNVQIEGRDKLSKEIESMFGGYELSIELEKMELPADFAKSLAEQFGFEYITLDELTNNLNAVRDEFFKLGDDGVKAWVDYEKRIADINKKAIEDRMKNLSKYLLKSKDERVRIEEEALKEIAKVESSRELTKEQKVTIKASIQKEAQTKIAKVDWEELKGLDLYKQSFEDLERLGTTTLNIILAKLEDFAAKSGQALDASGFRELMNNIKSVREETERRDPFKTMKESISGYREAIEEAIIAQRQLELSTANLKEKKGLKSEAEKKVEEAKIAVDLAPLEKKEQALLQLNNAQIQLNNATDEYNDAQKKQESSTNAVVAAEDKKKAALTKSVKSIESTKDAFQKMGDAIVNSIDLLKDLAEGLGVTFDPETEAIISSISKALGIVAGALGVVLTIIIAVTIAGTAMMTVLWPLLAIAAALSAVFAIVAIGDAKKEKKIKKEQERVEELEKAYKQLEKAIQAAFSFENLESSTKAAEENIKSQIKSYQAMIKAENDKKKTDKDKIKEWENTIDGLKEAQIKLREDFIETLGGFGSDEAFKDAAKDFTNSWLDAFKETGDGLSGLKDQFDEWIDNAVRQQVLLKLSNQYIKPILENMDKMFAKGSAGGIEMTKAELDALKEMMDKNAIAFDEAAKKYLEQLGILGDFGGGGAQLSGLQKGIQGVTEETASALEALLNSMRFFVADSNINLKNIYAIFADSSGSINPMLAELKTQTKILSAINNKLSSVIATAKQGSYGIRIV